MGIKQVSIRRLDVDTENSIIRMLRVSTRIRRYDPIRRKLIKVKRTRKLLNLRVFNIYTRPETKILYLRTRECAYLITYATQESLDSFLEYINTFLLNKDEDGMKVAIDFYCDL